MPKFREFTVKMPGGAGLPGPVALVDGTHDEVCVITSGDVPLTPEELHEIAVRRRVERAIERKALTKRAGRRVM